ncbi:hypothetical protein UFOVP116_87 [uncultured Caudovirales phage]|uniref:Uncharacterized protein n=1 Tax=uncultured Caudovirales phage TaxID=2100421 RepID=A0A6J5L8P7_9CAUD|nr:hypothetical protein UFOVP116_87 [uncultured Caudovirales phage]
MNYKTFYTIFLAEMPQRLQGSNDFGAQLGMLQENISYNNNVKTVNTNIFKLELGSQVTYWFGDESAQNVSIIVDTNVDGNFCKVVLSSKNPAIPQGSPPFASELYLEIKLDTGKAALVLTSDNLMSTDGEKLWKGLVQRGNKLSVYDTELSKYVLTPIESISQLDDFLGDFTKNKYVFVLSETADQQRGTMHSINIMELKRLANWPLFEFIEKSKQK